MAKMKEDGRKRVLSLLSIQGPTGQIVNIETCIGYSNMRAIESTTKRARQKGKRRSDEGEESYL